MSVTLLKDLRNFRIMHMPTERVMIRIGVHTGSFNTEFPILYDDMTSAKSALVMSLLAILIQGLLCIWL